MRDKLIDMKIIKQYFILYLLTLGICLIISSCTSVESKKEISKTDSLEFASINVANNLLFRENYRYLHELDAYKGYFKGIDSITLEHLEIIFGQYKKIFSYKHIKNTDSTQDIRRNGLILLNDMLKVSHLDSSISIQLKQLKNQLEATEKYSFQELIIHEAMSLISKNTHFGIVICIGPYPFDAHLTQFNPDSTTKVNQPVTLYNFLTSKREITTTDLSIKRTDGKKAKFKILNTKGNSVSILFMENGNYVVDGTLLAGTNSGSIEQWPFRHKVLVE